MADLLAVANIGPREIRKRRLLGLVAVVGAAVLGFELIAYHAPWWLRLTMFIPVWLAGLGLFQAREKT